LRLPSALETEAVEEGGADDMAATGKEDRKRKRQARKLDL
jgi:hypothetical protein